MTFSIFVGLFLILCGFKPIGKGFILGALLSVINFVLIGETLPIIIGKSQRKTFFLSLGMIIFRYTLMAIPVVMAVKFEQFNLFAVIAGLFSIQIFILADAIFNSVYSTLGKER